MIQEVQVIFVVPVTIQGQNYQITNLKAGQMLLDTFEQDPKILKLSMDNIQYDKQYKTLSLCQIEQHQILQTKIISVHQPSKTRSFYLLKMIHFCWNHETW